MPLAASGVPIPELENQGIRYNLEKLVHPADWYEGRMAEVDTPDLKIEWDASLLGVGGYWRFTRSNTVQNACGSGSNAVTVQLFHEWASCGLDVGFDPFRYPVFDRPGWGADDMDEGEANITLRTLSYIEQYLHYEWTPDDQSVPFYDIPNGQEIKYSLDATELLGFGTPDTYLTGTYRATVVTGGQMALHLFGYRYNGDRWDLNLLTDLGAANTIENNVQMKINATKYIKDYLTHRNHYSGFAAIAVPTIIDVPPVESLNSMSGMKALMESTSSDSRTFTQYGDYWAPSGTLTTRSVHWDSFTLDSELAHFGLSGWTPATRLRLMEGRPSAQV